MAVRAQVPMVPGLTCIGTSWGSAVCPCCCGSGDTRSPGDTGAAALGTARSCSFPVQSWCLKNMGPHGHAYTCAYSICALTAALVTQPKRETTQCPPMGEWINTMRSIHTVEYYLAIKRNKHWRMLQRGRTSKTLCSVKEAGHKKTTRCAIPFIWNVENRQIHSQKVH